MAARVAPPVAGVISSRELPGGLDRALELGVVGHGPSRIQVFATGLPIGPAARSGNRRPGPAGRRSWGWRPGWQKGMPRHDGHGRTPPRLSRRPRRRHPLGPRAGHAADAQPELPSCLRRRRLPDTRRAPSGPAPARAPQDRDGAERARDRVDDRHAGQRPHPRPRACRRGREPGAGGAGTLLRAGAGFRAPDDRTRPAERQPRGRRLHRRRPGYHGGGQPWRRRGRRALDQPQHRAAASSSARTSGERRTSASTSTISPCARCTS